jgi:C-terminal processing protease CtpA/Prc
MGTSHVILRNSQTNLKDSRINGTSEIKSTPSINNSGWSSYTPQAISPPRQLLTASPQLTEENLRSISEIVSNSSSSSIDDDLHEVHLHRSPNYPDFGFHLQYNRVYYIVHRIEHNSPAEHSGLRVGDVIRRVNNQTTDEMPHHILVEHIIHSKEVVFLVQTYEKFIRDNPEALLPPQKIVPDTKTKKVDWKYRNPLLRALSKLRSV